MNLPTLTFILGLALGAIAITAAKTMAVFLPILAGAAGVIVYQLRKKRKAS